jgi:hypothetical protein
MPRHPYKEHEQADEARKAGCVDSDIAEYQWVLYQYAGKVLHRNRWRKALSGLNESTIKARAADAYILDPSKIATTTEPKSDVKSEMEPTAMEPKSVKPKSAMEPKVELEPEVEPCKVPVVTAVVPPLPPADVVLTIEQMELLPAPSRAPRLVKPRGSVAVQLKSATPAKVAGPTQAADAGTEAADLTDIEAAKAGPTLPAQAPTSPTLPSSPADDATEPSGTEAAEPAHLSDVEATSVASETWRLELAPQSVPFESEGGCATPTYATDLPYEGDFKSSELRG